MFTSAFDNDDQPTLLLSGIVMKQTG